MSTSEKQAQAQQLATAFFDSTRIATQMVQHNRPWEKQPHTPAATPPQPGQTEK